MYNFSSLQLKFKCFENQFGVVTKIWGSSYLGGLTVGELFKNKAGFVKLSLSLQTFLDLKTNLYFLFSTLLKIDISSILKRMLFSSFVDGNLPFIIPREMLLFLPKGSFIFVLDVNFVFERWRFKLVCCGKYKISARSLLVAWRQEI